MLLFGSGILFAVPTADATGAAVTNPTPVQFGTLQDCSLDISFETKQLYGAYQFPISAGRGKGKIEGKAKNAHINAGILSDLLLGNPNSAGIKDIYPNFAAAVPSSTPWQITIAPPSSGTFVQDMGVLDATTGLAMKRVASGPTTGQYSVSAGGVYTFATADANKAVLISYEYSATSTAGPKYVTLTNQLMGYAPTFKAGLDLSFGGKNATVVLTQCISTKISLPFKNDDYAVPDFGFTAMADAAGNIGYNALSE